MKRLVIWWMPTQIIVKQLIIFQFQDIQEKNNLIIARYQYRECVWCGYRFFNFPTLALFFSFPSSIWSNPLITIFSFFNIEVMCSFVGSIYFPLLHWPPVFLSTHLIELNHGSHGMNPNNAMLFECKKAF